MKFISFASSSRGNCTFVSYKNTNLLIDCGISRKRVVNALEKYNKTLDDIDCILLTHSHDDHISGLPMILKEHDIKLMSQRETLEKVLKLCNEKGIKVNTESFRIVRPVNILNADSYVRIKDINVYPLKGTHDVPSLYFKLTLGDTNIATLTDMGEYSDYTIRSLEDVSHLMLECNYDKEMLMDSEVYKPMLKSRIMGRGGHLSNVDCSEIIMKLSTGVLKNVFLSHISDETNSEEYAFEFVNKYLKEKATSNLILPKVEISRRLEITEIINDDN